MNYELSYWEIVAEEQLQKPRMIRFFQNRVGSIKNNRKSTRGRFIQTIHLKNGTTRQIRKNIP